MYEVSDRYKEEMKKPIQHFYLNGYVGTGTSISFTDENILQGSFSITNQCSDDENIAIGQVYVGELDATFIGMRESVSRYNWVGKDIRAETGFVYEDGTRSEGIPLGYYTIDSAQWTASGIVVRAYDHMAKLDKKCSERISGALAWDVLSKISSATGVKIGMTRDEVLALPNGKIWLTESKKNDVETWRDLLSWLAQTVCCYATINRSGELVLRQYGDTPVDTIEPEQRFEGGAFSDFETKYTAISVAAVSDGKITTVKNDTNDGLTLELGSNPFLQRGSADTKKTMRKAILDGLQKICYVPFQISMIGNPAYDLGDVFVFKDGLADGDKISCMTKFTFTYNESYEMIGVGQNPALKDARSSTDKSVTGLSSSDDTMVHFHYTNTKAIKVPESEKTTIVDMIFSTGDSDSEVSEWCEVFFTLTKKDSSKNATVKFTYFLAETELDYHPAEVFSEDGRHTLSLHYYIGNVAEGKSTRWVVQLNTSNCELSIPKGAVNCVVEGFGLDGDGHWDGNITVNDKLKKITHPVKLMDLTDKVKVKIIDPPNPRPHDSMGTLDLDMTIQGFEDAVPMVTSLMFDQYSADALMSSSTATLNGGKYTNGEIILKKISGTTSVAIIANVNNNIKIQVSFDSGVTWYGWNADTWILDANMSTGQFNETPEVAWIGRSFILRAEIPENDTLTSIEFYGGALPDD